MWLYEASRWEGDRLFAGHINSSDSDASFHLAITFIGNLIIKRIGIQIACLLVPLQSNDGLFHQ